METRDDFLIMRPPVRNRSDVIVSKDHVQNIYFNQNESFSDKDDELQEAILEIRNIILEKRMWCFEGSFKTFEVDENSLQLFKS